MAIEKCISLTYTLKNKCKFLKIKEIQPQIQPIKTLELDTNIKQNILETILRFLRLILMLYLLRRVTFAMFLILSLPQTFSEELHDLLVQINFFNLIY